VKRGRKPRTLNATIRQVERLLAEEPDISAAQVAFRLGLRKQTAQLIVRGLREPTGRFPNSETTA
jgi:hypothetical protein